MPSMTQIREALASNLSTIPNVQVSAYQLSNPTPPAIHVVPGMTEYHQTFGGSSEAEWWEFTVQAFVAIPNDIGSQRRLDEMLESTGSSSVKAAIESDPTLGGIVDDLIVTTRTGYQLYVNEGRGTVLGAAWTVRVLL